jgi:thymidylate kinase
VDSRDTLDEVLPLLGTAVRVLHAPDPRANATIGGGDVDCAVHELDPMWPLRLPAPWRLLQCLQYDVTGWYWVLERDGQVHKVDTLDDPNAIGPYAFATGSAFHARPGELEAVSAAYLTTKRLRKGITDELHWEHVRSLAASNRDRFDHELGEIFGTDVGRGLADAVERGAAPDPALWRRARARAWRRRLRSPGSQARLAKRALGRVVERLMRPTGFTVVIAGPDGTGKSTLAGALPEVCEGPFRRHLHLHWRPGVLPSLGARTTAGDPTEPHGRPPHGPVASIAALGYYWFDFLLGSWLRIAPLRTRSGLVIVERGWWDVAVDPRRYRMDVPPALVRFLGHLLPKPDLVLLLKAPATVLSLRKGELSDDEARRQSDAWNDVLPTNVDRTDVDASAPIDEVAAGARDAIFKRLSDRAVRRLGSGWTGMPPGSHRWLFPRGPRATAASGLAIYQPVTYRGRVGWEIARSIARAGGFRLLPHAEAPPRSVREAVAPFVPARSTLATMRANHPSRHVVAVIDEGGRMHAIAKVASDDHGNARLHAEADAMGRLASCLSSPVHAPRLIAEGDGVLVLEVVQWRPRTRPWVLPIDVARASGELFRRTASPDGKRGAAHGDLAPWNVLLTDGGWTLVDWESASTEAPPFTDVLHYLVQAHALLGRPSRRDLIASVATGSGSGGAAIRVYGLAAGVSAGIAFDVFHEYLERTLPTLDPHTRDGRRGIRARRSLLRAIASGAGSVREWGS